MVDYSANRADERNFNPLRENGNYVPTPTIPLRRAFNPALHELTMSFAQIPVEGETLTIAFARPDLHLENRVYTFKATPTLPRDITIGVDDSANRVNITAALNNSDPSIGCPLVTVTNFPPLLLEGVVADAGQVFTAVFSSGAYTSAISTQVATMTPGLPGDMMLGDDLKIYIFSQNGAWVRSTIALTSFDGAE